MTRECTSFIFDPRGILLSLQIGFSFVRAAVACAILEKNRWFGAIIPRYLALVTVPSFCHFTFISLWMPLALFVISLVFLALTAILYLCRFCRDFLLGLLAPVLPQLQHLCHRQTADWKYFCRLCQPFHHVLPEHQTRSI